MSEQDPDNSPLKDGAVDVGGAKQFSGQSRSRIYLAMQKGELPYYTSGSRRFIARTDLRAWMEKILTPVG